MKVLSCSLLPSKKKIKNRNEEDLSTPYKLKSIAIISHAQRETIYLLNNLLGLAIKAKIAHHVYFQRNSNKCIL